MTEKSKSQITKQNIFIIAVLIGLCGIIANTSSYYYKEWHDSHWQKLTSPLTPARQKKLCNDLGLPENYPKCLETAVVYGPDFYPEVKRRLQPLFGERATYEEVEKIFEGYRDECEPPRIDSNGNETFRCRYDLRCDNVFWFWAVFRGNGELIRLHFSTELYDARPLRINFCLADYVTPLPP